MGQRFHKYKAPTLDEAYKRMRRDLGEDAVVVNTSESTEPGWLGVWKRKAVEVTASMPAPPASTKRRLSRLEKKYNAAAKPVGSKERVDNTVEYFQQIVGDAQKRMASASRAASGSSQAVAAEAPIIPFGKLREKSDEKPDELRREVKEIREMLQVLMSETPGAGLPAEFAPHYRRLVEQGLTRRIAASLVSATVQNSDLDVVRDPRVFSERLKFEIRKLMSVTGGIGLCGGSCRVVALVGPTGVGKTTNLAKLAALFGVHELAKIAFITSDTYRVAASEQLRVYSNIIGVPLTVVNDEREMATSIRDHRDYDLVLIDTAGGSQFNLKQIDELRGLLSVAQPDETMLMLSANTQLEEMRSTVANFRCLNPTSIFFSKLDETRRYGAMLSLIIEEKFPLSYVSNGQNVPDDISLAHPGELAKIVLEGGKSRG